MKYTSTVRAFGGIDENRTFSDDLAYATYMRNYRVTENRTLQKRFGLTTLIPAGAAVTGLWSGYLGGERLFLYTAGSKLFSIEQETGIPVELGDVGEGRNLLFEFGRAIYIKNQNKYSRYDGKTLSEVTGYVPLVAIGCGADGKGEPFEDINLLSSRRRVQFSGDGTSATYTLPEKNIKSIVSVRENGATYALNYSVDYAKGTITPEEPFSAGINNVEITYDTGKDRAEVILDATGVMLFGGDTDGHVFLWGNPDYPAYRFHSEPADGLPSAEYFPENNYTIIGDSEITDIISQYDRQLIFTKDRAFYSYRELQTDTLGNVYASFPVYNLNGEKGNLLKNAGCIMNNEPVTLCADGLNRWSSTTVENEKNAVCFSGAIGKSMQKLLASGDFSSVRLFNLRATGELFLIVGETAYIYNYRVGAWYVYDNFAADFMTECGGMLFFSRGENILFLDETSNFDNEGMVKACWESPFASFGDCKRSRVTEIDFSVRAGGTPSFVWSYQTDRDDPLGAVTALCPENFEIRVFDMHFRPPVPTSAYLKLKLNENDYASCEILSLQVTAVGKGNYGRKGL